MAAITFLGRNCRGRVVEGKLQLKAATVSLKETDSTRKLKRISEWGE